MGRINKNADHSDEKGRKLAAAAFSYLSGSVGVDYFQT
jgi:hypothetical protein